MNLRPPGPQPGALPDCATPRGIPDSTGKSALRRPPTVRTCVRRAMVPASTRTCGRCRQLLPTSSFAWRRKELGQLDNYCRTCRATYKREHYVAHRDRYIAGARQHKQAVVARRAAQLVEFFRDHPCVDCGESDPLVLEFDHHRGDKSFNIARGARDRNWGWCSMRLQSARWFVQTVIDAEPPAGRDPRAVVAQR